MRKQVVIPAAVVAALCAWFAFRPEKLFTTERVQEAFPAVVAAGSKAPASPAMPKPIRTGRFHAVAHEGAGTASIYELEGGKRILRLTGFKTSNGPKLHLYLVAASDATDDATVKTAGFIDLGPLKGNEGDQNYELGVETDLGRYRAVTVWCARFNVNFTTAPLAAQMEQAQ